MKADERSVKTNLRKAIAEFCDWRVRNHLCEDEQCEFCPVNDTYDMAREPEESDDE